MVSELRLDGPLGCWTRHEWRPRHDSPLAPVVKLVAHWDGRATLPRERVFPDTAVELVVHMGEPHRLASPTGSTVLPAACISGISSRPATVEAPPGRARALCIRLHPAGAYALLGHPLTEISDRTVDLADCIGRAAGAVTAACEGAAGPVERIHRAVAWLSARVAGAAAADPAVAWAAGEIERRGGAITISELPARTGLSPSRFWATFRQQLGVTPKRYARIARFRRALALLHQQHPPTLSATALAAGYYDQAHMNADFRAFGSLTPGEFVSAVRPAQWIGMVEPAP
ncbi:MAG: helix-turn-helix domain-containing protein [Gemmatimonadota bacterium]